jgi:hypothetical protein
MVCPCTSLSSLPILTSFRINALASIDPRLVSTLQALRAGTFSYIRGTLPPDAPELTTALAADLGFPRAWGDPALIPAYGAARGAADAYARLGVKGRSGLGGLPCEIVHGGVDRHSCVANAGKRGMTAFLKALLIYTPVRRLFAILAPGSPSSTL